MGVVGGGEGGRRRHVVFAQGEHHPFSVIRRLAFEGLRGAAHVQGRHGHDDVTCQLIDNLRGNTTQCMYACVCVCVWFDWLGSVDDAWITASPARSKRLGIQHCSVTNRSLSSHADRLVALSLTLKSSHVVLHFWSFVFLWATLALAEPHTSTPSRPHNTREAPHHPQEAPALRKESGGEEEGQRVASG